MKVFSLLRRGISLTISLLAVYGTVPLATAGSFGLCLLYACAVLSVTFFLSSVSKGAMGATVITLVFIMVISSIVDTVLIMTDQPHCFMLSTNGDAVTTIYGGYEAFMGGFGGGGAMFPFEFENPSISLSILSMAGYLVLGFLLSLWISKRRQLA